MRTFYPSKGCSSVGNAYSLDQSCIRDMISELCMDPNTHLSNFPIRHFVRDDTRTSKTPGRIIFDMQNIHIIWMFCISNDSSTIGDV